MNKYLQIPIIKQAFMINAFFMSLSAYGMMTSISASPTLESLHEYLSEHKEYIGGAVILVGSIAMYRYLNRSEDDLRLGMPTYARKHFLEIINSLAPELYEKIIKVEPTGLYHFDKYTGCAGIFFSEEDGLPFLCINYKKVMTMPIKIQRAIIAHELGHYALGHQLEKSAIKLKHSHLFKDSFYDKSLTITTRHKKIRVTADFSPHESFQNAASRVREYEADRFAVLQFGIPIDDCVEEIELLKKLSQSHLWFFQKETPYHAFESSHPLFKQRIEHIRSLGPEVTLGYKSALINWNDIIEEYKQNLC